MIHRINAEWSLPNIERGSIDCRLLFRYVQANNFAAKLIRLSEISHKPLDIDRSSARFQAADVNYPLLIVDGMQNPDNRRYRLVDGRHRLLKLLPCSEVRCYVIPLDVALYYVRVNA